MQMIFCGGEIKVYENKFLQRENQNLWIWQSTFLAHISQDGGSNDEIWNQMLSLRLTVHWVDLIGTEVQGSEKCNSQSSEWKTDQTNFQILLSAATWPKVWDHQKCGITQKVWHWTWDAKGVEMAKSVGRIDKWGDTAISCYVSPFIPIHL